MKGKGFWAILLGGMAAVAAQKRANDWAFKDLERAGRVAGLDTSTSQDEFTRELGRGAGADV